MSDENDKKKRKFLSRKFRAVASGTKWNSGIIVIMAASAAPFDMGTSLSFVLGGGAGALASTFINFKSDKGNQKIKTRHNMADQKLMAPGWALDLFDEIEADMIKTCKALAKHASNRKKRAKLETRKEKLLEVARDLEDYIKIVDEDSNTVKTPILYMTRTPTGELIKDRRHMIDSKGIARTPDHKKPDPPKAFGL